VTVTDPITRFFDALEIPTLSRAIESGTVNDRPSDDLENYARVALVRWHAVDEHDMEMIRPENDLFASHFGHLLAVSISGDESYGYRVDVDGRVWVDQDGVDPTEVTDDRLRHWQWMLTLLRDRKAADDFLAAVNPLCVIAARRATKGAGRYLHEQAEFKRITRELG
jgi:hypothetical protein